MQVLGSGVRLAAVLPSTHMLVLSGHAKDTQRNVRTLSGALGKAVLRSLLVVCLRSEDELEKLEKLEKVGEHVVGHVVGYTNRESANGEPK
jgi:hypothetical protein